jgi:hypothetical protein
VGADAAAHAPGLSFYGTAELPNTMEKAVGKIQDKLHRE